MWSVTGISVISIPGISMADEFVYQAIETLDHVGYLKIEERAFARPPTLRLFLMWGDILHALAREVPIGTSISRD
jgi:hypothetical protein